MSAVPQRRRHGAELEAAILDAAWDELLAVGYARLTMGSVAVRAQTSEPVLYRRWPNKDGLVIAALQRFRDANPVELPDTGALRTDLVAELTAISAARAPFFAIVVGAAMSGLLADTGMTPAEVRARVMSDLPATRDRALYRRAAARHEIDLDRVPESVLAMPFDLVRQDLLMQLAPPSDERVTTIVDELFLPLVSRHGGAPPDGAPPSGGARRRRSAG